MGPDLGQMDDAQEWEVHPAVVYRQDLENLVQGAIDAGDALAAAGEPSRTLNLVMTKLDEAQLWLTRIDKEGKETT